MPENVRVAIDVGGTFTDVVKLVPGTRELRFEKVPTTPAEPTSGVLAAFDKAEADPAQTETFNHGSTLGLNSLLTRTGARIATIATRGFRDVYLLGRTDRTAMYDIGYQKPAALLERYDTFEVTERCYFDGSVAQPFDEEDARVVAREIAERGYQAVAVGFLHSYTNPAHELRMREVLQEEAPDVEVTLSHELSREYREYERTSTAVLDAYIKPIMRSYLRALEGELEHRGFDGRFLMSRSGGGAMTATSAREQPVNLILSGPAGGVVGAAAFSKLIERPNLITIDMGGTSLDASLVQNGAPVLYHGAEFEGLPINTPSLYIHTIGAGGGSLAYLDDAGALQVGPKSAGATPGPAAYGRGGTEPTFTDAALAIGYLVQTDIKRVIAYSTCSQLGYMFFAAGVGAYSAAMFHLFTHAFFKALLFLGAGSVIHAMHHEQDMRYYGGLRKEIPLTFWAMMMGTLAITGVGIVGLAGFAGFYSKDAIIEAAFASGTSAGQVAFAIGVLSACLTSFYSWRLMFLTFWGTPRWIQSEHIQHSVHKTPETAEDSTGGYHPHESPLSMLIPLGVLSLGSIAAGFLFHDAFIDATEGARFWAGSLAFDRHLMHAIHEVPMWVKLASTVAMLTGLLVAYLMYFRGKDRPARLAATFLPVYKFFFNKWYFDELYNLIFVRPAFWFGRLFWKTGDEGIIDRFGPNGVAAFIASGSGIAKRFQNGYLYSYALVMLMGLAAAVTWIIVRGAN